MADALYDADVFDDGVLVETNPRAQDNLIHLCEFVRDFLDRDDFDLEIDYIEVFNGGSQMSSSEALDLHRRWARQAEQVLKAHTVPRQYL